MRGFEEEFDVVVLGFGGAGACAAIQAADEGARVLVAERFDGGGATSRSGGVIYLGGGSETQRAAGFDDDEEQMFRYLFKETGGAVSEFVLRAFCKESLNNYRWLRTLGLDFPSKFFPHKTTQPPDEYGLYYSGNEKQRGKGRGAVPRGHVPTGTGMRGNALFEGLKKAALERGVEVRTRTRAVKLLTDPDGRVCGVEVQTLAGNPAVNGLRSLLFNLSMASRSCVPALERLERDAGRTYRVRARSGVVICTGGFVFNSEMMQRYAPRYARCMPLGTAGDDGSGIRLGRSVGAAVAGMDQCAAWRFIYPPEAFVMGVVVNERGERICDESLYGATFCRHISEQPGGRAFLIVDAGVLRVVVSQLEQEERLRDQSVEALLSGRMNALIFRKLTAFVNTYINRKKADSIEELEAKCKIPSGRLVATIEEYNRSSRYEEPDRFGKAPDYVRPIAEPPFLAIHCDLDNRLFLGPCITLGGLRVDGLTAQVLREDGSTIEGLYAAGRSAAGICSGGYVSGLSIADCIFSGRNAGRSVTKTGSY